MQRRHFLSFVTASSVLAACSNSAAFKTINSAYDMSFGNKPSFDPSYPDQLPYASIAVSMKNLPKALLVLGKVEGDEMHWFSGDRGVFVTRFGRLIRTVGMAENITKTDFSSPDFFENATRAKTEASLSRIIDLSPGNRYGIKVDSKLKELGKETITIGTKTRETTHFEEYCYAPLLSWRCTNHYWVGESSQVWRSIQQASPAGQSITIELTKPFKA